MRARVAIAGKSEILLGVDLVKDRSVLEAAYDDATGVTAAFNLNALNHVNRIIGADFDPARWRHVAFFNEEDSRIEMHLEAQEDQIIAWRGGERHFRKGERMLTEYSRKWRKEEIGAMLRDPGFSASTLWTDAKERFAVALGTP